jgi:hypothetical protein
MSPVPLACPDTIWAALNFRSLTRFQFILNESGIKFDLCHFGFHARNFLILIELAGSSHP